MAESGDSRKRQRLERVAGLLKVSRTSLSNLREIAEHLRDHPIGFDISQSCLQRAQAEFFQTIGASVDLPMKDGTPFHWEFCDPRLQIKRVLERCPGLASSFRRAAEYQLCTPTRPWSLLVYWDEMTPGDSHAPDNLRKSMCVYYTFTELGMDTICTAGAWFALAVVRTSMISEVVGGWGRMLATLLKVLLIDMDPLRAGLPLVADGLEFVLFYKLTNLLADLEGHRAAYDSLGFGSALRTCLLCKNAVGISSELVGDNLVDLSCEDFSQFEPESLTGLYNRVDAILLARERHESGQLAKARLERLTTGLGFHANPHGLLADPALRRTIDPLRAFTIDTMHLFFCNGVFARELSSLMKACAPLGIRWSSLDILFKADWRFPGNLTVTSLSLHTVGKEKRHTETQVKLKASECLGVMTIVRHWAELHLSARPSLRAELLSFLECCAIGDQLQAAKRGKATPTLLRQMHERYMRLHKAAYGTQVMTYKHHGLGHVPEQLQRDGALLDAFTAERKHNTIKASIGNVRNTVRFEASALALAQMSQERDAESLSVAPGLRGRTQACGQLGVVVASSLYCSGMTVKVGDAVYTSTMAGIVMSCLDLDGLPHLLVEPWSPPRALTETSERRRKVNAQCRVVPATEVSQYACWYFDTRAGDVVLLYR